MINFSFDPPAPPPGLTAFREDVRAFLRENLVGVSAVRKAHSWSEFDADFSRRMAERGYIGLTWPKRYGGGERGALERYVLLEEMLAAGAPVGAHWIADRQSGPLLLRYGTEEQRQRFLPPIIRGEMFFCIGMSEPNAGSDLASVRTRAARVDGGWRVTGQKIWTTHAHQADMMIALVRTGEGQTRQDGLSQLLIDLSAPGVTVRPIADLVGDAHFNEVFLDEAFVPDDALVGVEGKGWEQVTGELSLERSGPERYLSSHILFHALLRVVGPNPPDGVKAVIGRIAAQLWTLREMSLSVAGQLAAGRDPAVEAAIVKDLGNSFEQELPRLVQAVADNGADDGVNLADDGDFARVLAFLIQASPSFSLRGGTREILRGIIARGLGLR